MKTINKHICFLFLLICSFVSVPAFSQELSYVHYDEKDGLAGNTIYDMTFDKDGFLWLATENGASRFDGKNFKNYSVTDGLYDNEIIRVFADSKNRVWISSLSKHLSFYQGGKIHNIYNDGLLAAIHMQTNLIEFAEDKESNMMFSDGISLLELTKDNHIIDVAALPMFKGVKVSSTFSNPFKEGFYMVTRDKVFVYDHKTLEFAYYTIPEPGPNYLVWKIDPDNKIYDMIIPDAIFSTALVNTTSYVVNTVNGAWELDTVTQKLKTHFLPGLKITRSISDPEKNLWFGSFGNGLYKLASKSILTYRLRDNNQDNSEVFSITADNNYIYGGCDFGKAIVISRALHDSQSPKDLVISSVKHRANRIYSSCLLRDSSLVFGLDRELAKLKKGVMVTKDIWPVKSIAQENNETLIVGTSKCVLRVNIDDLNIKDTLWKGRCSVVNIYDHEIYIGTFDGLYKISRDGILFFEGDKTPALGGRINDIKTSADGITWIASNGHGIAGMQNGMIVKTFDENNGLSGNICKTLFIEGKNLWVGTNKGISKISFTNSVKSVITKYSISDGLPSDLINALYVKDSVIWAGTPEGLTKINEKDLYTFSLCRLKLIEVKTGRRILEKDSVSLTGKENNISFYFTAVSFKSGGLITYFYRLKGLNEEWKTTAENNLIWEKLEPGNYSFELYAVNKFGVKSDTVFFHFNIPSPFWQKPFFIVSCVILGLILIILTGIYINRRSLKKLKTKADMEQQILSLEQQALQARMNPHFIFNCLNSIQQHILTNDKEMANKTLTDFASFVRRTLDYSEKKNIRINEECEYLQQYLEMEKMRFGDIFNYEIIADKSVDTEFTDIPAFLLQPYVENSINHGLRHLKDRRGILRIYFTRDHDLLICTVTDNGIGREASANSFKMSGHISKGSSIAEKRVALLGIMNNKEAAVTTKDLYDDKGNAAGTEVIIKLIY